MMNTKTSKNRIALLSFVISILSFSTLFAQNSDTVEMADTMHNSKIYVVVAVLSVIFTGIAAYLIRLDLRITKMEKEKRG